MSDSPRLRVGDPGSPIRVGDLNPNTSMPYRAGQFSPSLDELTQDILMAADKANVLPSDLPVYDDAGNLDLDKLEAWEPAKSLITMDLEPDSDVPKYVAALILAALNQFRHMPRRMGLKSIVAAPRTEMRAGLFGDVIVAARFTGKGSMFTSAIEVYPDFYKFVDVPLAPKIPGRASGISVASYAILHAFGHIVFANLAYTGKMDEIAPVLRKGVWSREKTITNRRGEFFNTPVSDTWYYSTQKDFPTELSQASPSDDFAETFALYVANPAYLEAVYPDKYAAIEEIVEAYVL